MVASFLPSVGRRCASSPPSGWGPSAEEGAGGGVSGGRPVWLALALALSFVAPERRLEPDEDYKREDLDRKTCVFLAADVVVEILRF